LALAGELEKKKQKKKEKLKQKVLSKVLARSWRQKIQTRLKNQSRAELLNALVPKTKRQKKAAKKMLKTSGVCNLVWHLVCVCFGVCALGMETHFIHPPLKPSLLHTPCPSKGVHQEGLFFAFFIEVISKTNPC
jgi:hypothetical protein